MIQKRNSKPRKPGLINLLERGKILSDLPGVAQFPELRGALKGAILGRNTKAFKKLTVMLIFKNRSPLK